MTYSRNEKRPPRGRWISSACVAALPVILCGPSARRMHRPRPAMGAFGYVRMDDLARATGKMT